MTRPTLLFYCQHSLGLGHLAAMAVVLLPFTLLAGLVDFGDERGFRQRDLVRQVFPHRRQRSEAGAGVLGHLQQGGQVGCADRADQFHGAAAGECRRIMPSFARRWPMTAAARR